MAMGAHVLTFDEVRGRTFEDVIQDILAQEAIVTVLLPDGNAVVIEPKLRLKPLPELPGRLPEGWKDAIYARR
jgi:hypothetical protein